MELKTKEQVRAVVVQTLAETFGLPPEKLVPGADLYKVAMNQMKEENYGTAAKVFDEVERQHPYSVWATRAQLMAAYADYEGLRYDDAIDALTRFIELHPGNPHVDYAYYMRALCYYEQIADIRRDQRASQQAYEGFNDVIRRFPDTAYAHDARYKLDLTRDHLAAKEMDVGRWYEGQGNYIAAINRFKTEQRAGFSRPLPPQSRGATTSTTRWPSFWGWPRSTWTPPRARSISSIRITTSWNSL